VTGTRPVVVGQRVRLTVDVDRYPHFIARQGGRGTVTYYHEDDHGGIVAVQMDQPITHPDAQGVDHPAATEWNNEIQWDEDIAHAMGCATLADALWAEVELL